MTRFLFALGGGAQAVLVLVNKAAGVARLLLGNGDFTFRHSGDYVVGRAADSLAISDFNKDGSPDLAVACSDGVYVLLMHF